MRLPKGLPNNVILRTWMDNTRNNDTRVHTSFVSPILWKQTSDCTPHVVTLNLRPFRTTNLSLDSFMAAHCPRRNCRNRQKFMLKPLDQKDVCGSVQSEYGCTSPIPFSTVQNRLLQDKDQPVRSSSNCSQTREVSASVVTLGAYESTKQYHGIVPDTSGACPLRNNSFRPSTKLSQATGQKIQIGNTFGFKAGHFNLLQQSDIVARGKSVLTQKNEEQIIKPTQRWKCKNEQVNEKAFKYVDPLAGASSNYQERLAEITQHELDTIKWERTKKGKKKTVSSS